MTFKNLGSEGELFPQSVFIIASYDEDGTPNAMNAAWAGECSRHEICFNIGDHKTTANIVAKGAFTVAPADAAHVVEADYFGIATGNKVDKAAASGLTFTRVFTTRPTMRAPCSSPSMAVTSHSMVSGNSSITGASTNSDLVNVMPDAAALSTLLPVAMPK